MAALTRRMPTAAPAPAPMARPMLTLEPRERGDTAAVVLLPVVTSEVVLSNAMAPDVLFRIATPISMLKGRKLLLVEFARHNCEELS